MIESGERSADLEQFGSGWHGALELEDVVPEV